MGILTWIIVAVVVLAVVGLGIGTFFSGVWRGAEVIGNNPAVQNVTDPVRDFVGETVGSGIGTEDTNEKKEGDAKMVALTTSKAVYSKGEPVTFTVYNNADQALEFPNSVLGLEITNADTGEMIPIFSAQVITTIEAGQSKSMTLPLEGTDGQPAKAGTYLAKVYMTPRDEDPVATVTFEIN